MRMAQDRGLRGEWSDTRAGGDRSRTVDDNGQTAPGCGITIRGPLTTRQDTLLRDIVVRFLRVRPGPHTGWNQDAVSFDNVERCILDHISLSWGSDENMGIYNARISQCSGVRSRSPTRKVIRMAAAQCRPAERSGWNPNHDSPQPVHPPPAPQSRCGQRAVGHPQQCFL